MKLIGRVNQGEKKRYLINWRYFPGMRGIDVFLWLSIVIQSKLNIWTFGINLIPSACCHVCIVKEMKNKKLPFDWYPFKQKRIFYKEFQRKPFTIKKNVFCVETKEEMDECGLPFKLWVRQAKSKKDIYVRFIKKFGQCAAENIKAVHEIKDCRS